MKNFKLKFSEYMQNIRRSKSFGKFVLIVNLNLKVTIGGAKKASHRTMQSTICICYLKKV